MAYLSRGLPLCFSGSHFLLNIISFPGKLGNDLIVVFVLIFVILVSSSNTASAFLGFKPVVSSDLTGILHLLDGPPEDSLPSSDLLVLGFSADVADGISKINSNRLSKLLQASQNPLGAVRGFSTQPPPLPDYNHTRERLQALEDYLTQRSHSGGTNAGGQGPLFQFLQSEWDDLHDSVTTLLSHLRGPVHCRMPTCGFLPDLTHLSHLERRAKLLCSYLWRHSTADPLGSYRLAAFRNARGFLLAVMRQAAHVQGRYIGNVTPRLRVRFNNLSPPACVSYRCLLHQRCFSRSLRL